MPSTLISVRRDWPPDRRRALMEEVHAAMVESIGIPEHDRCVRLQRFESADFMLPAPESETYTLVEITLYPGRTLAAKKDLYQAVVRRLGAFGIAPADVRVILHEVPPDNWGLRGGQAGSEIHKAVKEDV